MKKILFLVAAVGALSMTTYAQTQKTNRTKTRPHNETDTVNKRNMMRNDPATRMAPENDMDENNPNNTNKTNTNGTDNNTNGTTPAGTTNHR